MPINWICHSKSEPDLFYKMSDVGYLNVYLVIEKPVFNSDIQDFSYEKKIIL